MFEFHTERDYIFLLEEIVHEGILVPTRTGINCFTLPHAMMTFDMSDGTLPLMTHKRMGLKSISAELWCFLHGVTSKAEFNKAGTSIWNEWANPQRVAVLKREMAFGEGIDPTKELMLAEDDLGPIYGAQWRNFGYTFDEYGTPTGTDQIASIEAALKTKEGRESRRLLCSAWNPNQLGRMALPPCHTSWHVRVLNDTLHLSYTMRSQDAVLGAPYNIASYGILLALLADTHNLKRGQLTTFISDAHVYENHLDGVTEISRRATFPFPKLYFSRKYDSILEWSPAETVLTGYRHQEAIRLPVAV